MLKAHVVFATITGHNEDVADIVTEGLEGLGVQTIETEISQTDPEEFKDVDICVVCAYTYNEGHLPEEGLDFYEDLQKLDLSKQTYGVAGSGDTFYKNYYNVAVDKFDHAFQLTNAKHGAANVKINLEPDAKDIKTLDNFSKQLVNVAKKNK
ncbi:flavodoxin [Acetilactobacillus jinshanensis]|uniref:Flavodoxin n=1 Tax=Acetilactobacillus jinshanensis TaxID=1720083 RepID=A0A4P6ZKC3_9LACO|nr:flavodoxin [Acetilactobacillus jinshanensis]QBP17872.1 flavodoxin [Acetilactobacillus jinshanensis]URL60733.1 flavodoxin [uncultured bacterium]